MCRHVQPLDPPAKPFPLPRLGPSSACPPTAAARPRLSDTSHPERWDAEVANHQPADDRRPGRGRPGRGRKHGRRPCCSSATFTWPTARAGGDDFLDSHLRRDDELGGLYTGFFPPGESRRRAVRRPS